MLFSKLHVTIFLFLLDATVRSGIEGTGPFFLSEVECTGSEDNLTACPSDSVGRHVCSRQDSAGVTCTSLIQDSDTDAGIIAGAVTGAGVTCTSLIQDSDTDAGIIAGAVTGALVFCIVVVIVGVVLLVCCNLKRKKKQQEKTQSEIHAR